MKKLFYSLCVLLVCSSCINIHIGNGKTIRCKGPVVEKTMEGLTGFTAIVVNGSSDLTVSQSDVFSVVVTANEEVFRHLDYRVENGVLIMGTLNNVPIRAEKYDIAVTLPVAESITVNGAADVLLKGSYASDKEMKVSVNGAGDLNFGSLTAPGLILVLNGASDVRAKELDVQTLSVTVNGAGDAVLGGKAASASFSVNGAGDIDARDLECDNITTRKSGVASIRTRSK